MFNYSVDLFTTYEIRLLVEVKGHKVQLGRVKFETGEKIYTISKTDDLKLLTVQWTPGLPGLYPYLEYNGKFPSV